MGPEIKRVVACGQPSRAPKIIHRQRCDTHLGKTQCQILVELMQPTHIGIDEHLRSYGITGPGSIGSKTIPVCHSKHNIFALSSTICPRRHRWTCIVVVTHVVVSFTCFKVKYGGQLLLLSVTQRLYLMVFVRSRRQGFSKAVLLNT